MITCKARLRPSVARNLLAVILVALVTTGCLFDEKNQAPMLISQPVDVTVMAGQPVQVKPVAVDPDGDEMVFEIENQPRWTAFNDATGELSGMPREEDAGTYDGIRISATDGKKISEGQAFKIVVNAAPAAAAEPTPPAEPPAAEPPPAELPPAPPPPAPPPPPPNQAPQISGAPATAVTEGQAYSFTPSASDPDGGTLTFSIANKPSWASFSTGSGSLSGTPATGSAGGYANITISVSDGTDSASLPPFTITVIRANRAPTISGSPGTSVREGGSYSFRPSASDPDGDSLTFRIAGKPSWASFNTATGELSGTPPAGSAGSFPGIAISASDGNLSASLAPFTIAVAANRPPSISGSPADKVTVGQGYSFTPNASDPDGQSLTFSISNKPGWASFSTGNGRLTGTPAASDVGAHVDIVIRVSDGMTESSLPAFEIAVEAANRAPTISGTPAASVVEGQAYSFRPTASDPDGDTLTFSIANKPSWASFNTGNGQLSGTPGTGTVGSYPNVVITVTDGKAQASLAGFGINVQQAATGSATLSWTPPTTRTDGSPLTNLAGYKVHYGTSQGSYPNKITINNAGVTTYVVENLAPATYYFVTTAFDDTGGESDYSNVASKTIR